MPAVDTLNRLEIQVTRLIEGALERKTGQIDYLIGLNRLDDILRFHQQGESITEKVTIFLADYRDRRTEGALAPAQRKRLGALLGELFQCLSETDDPDCRKLAEDVKEWLRGIGGAFRLVLKRPKEQISLADRYKSLMDRETQELEALISQHDHLLTVLDDLLTSAEAKTDTIYRHMAASIIYFLQMEGYKVEPYLKRLRQLRSETLQ